jgi:hypothetical protein
MAGKLARAELDQIEQRSKRDSDVMMQKFKDAMDCDQGSRASSIDLAHDHQLERQYQQQDWEDDHRGQP